MKAAHERKTNENPFHGVDLLNVSLNIEMWLVTLLITDLWINLCANAVSISATAHEKLHLQRTNECSYIPINTIELIRIADESVWKY